MDYYKRVFELLPNAYLLVKANPPDFTIVNISDYHCSVTKRTRDELVGNKLFDMFPGQDESNNKVRDALMEVLANGKFFSHTLQYAIPNGSNDFVSKNWVVQYTLICDENNVPQEIAIAPTDTTGLMNLVTTLKL